MAKDELLSLLASVASLKEGAVLGDQEGQYTQEQVDRLVAAIESAKIIVTDENATDEQVNSAVIGLKEAEQAFKSSVVVKPTKEKKVTLKDIILKGTDIQKKGIHTVYSAKDVVTFRDGVAQISPDTAKRLIKEGIAEEAGE